MIREMKYMLLGLVYCVKMTAVAYALGAVVMWLTHWLHSPVDFWDYNQHLGAVLSGMVVMLFGGFLYALGGGFANED